MKNLMNILDKVFRYASMFVTHIFIWGCLATVAMFVSNNSILNKPLDDYSVLVGFALSMIVLLGITNLNPMHYADYIELKAEIRHMKSVNDSTQH